VKLVSVVPLALFGLVVLTIICTYGLHKFSNWLSRFALVSLMAIRPTVFCANCPEPVHGCTHFKGVPSTWEHDYGYTACRNPYPDAPENATAWHS
jgi:hypothetical protein